MDHVILEQLDGKAAVLDHAVGRGHLSVVAAGADEKRNQRGDDHETDGERDHDLDQAHAGLPGDPAGPTAKGGNMDNRMHVPGAHVRLGI